MTSLEQLYSDLLLAERSVHIILVKSSGEQLTTLQRANDSIHSAITQTRNLLNEKARANGDRVREMLRESLAR
jgi:hypothetical protein